MMHEQVRDWIFTGNNEEFSIEEVSHIVKDKRPNYQGNISVIFKHSRWQNSIMVQGHEPSVYLSQADAEKFRVLWRAYCKAIDYARRH